MLSPGFSESMCGQPIYLVRVVLTVIDFFPCLVFSSQKPRCLFNEAQTHSGLLQPRKRGEIWLVEGRESWRKSTERFIGPNYSYWIVLNQENYRFTLWAGGFILDIFDIQRQAGIVS